jgi:alginate O-acetyltransferase complex protein AlgI
MSFTSLTFVVFLAAVYGAYRLLPHREQNLLLLVASYVFYGGWDVRFLFLLIVSTAVYYASGLLIHRGSMTARARAAISVVTLVSAFSFVVVQWTAVDLRPWRLQVRWGELLGSRNAWLVFLGTAALLVIANLLHGAFARMETNARRQLAMWLAIGSNIAILGVFKYFNFFSDNLEALLRGVGLQPARLHLAIALPVGISFYTFQGMSYALDVYRKRLVPTERFGEFALFLAFFPLILAGPIERGGHLLPQLARPRSLRPSQTTPGLYLIFYGLFKKAVIADGVASTANAVFAAGGPVSWIDVVVGSLFFAVQLYCDFSGYSDMAIGTASLFGIDLMTNFRLPYFSRNPAEFWTRWHISLSSWFRDYVFFPLGGPYGKASRWIRNVLLTFLATGLWHGAAWHFVLWGLYHGALLCVHRMKDSIWKPPPSRSPLASAAAMAGFFMLTCYGWVLFRCGSMQQIGSFTATLLLDFGNLHLTAPLPPASTLFGLPIFAALELVGYLFNGKRVDELLPVPAWTACYAAMLFALVLGAGAVSAQFVYFTF